MSAKAAGVSRATVSYVLNGVDARVSEETRERVLDAARELGYVPHAFASALRAGRTSVVVIALPAWPLGPPVAEMISACVGRARPARLHAARPLPPLGRPGRADQGVRPRPARRPDRARRRPAARARRDAARERHARGHRARAPSRWSTSRRSSFDQRLVGEVAIEHLAERGHRHVLAICPTEPELLDLGERGWAARTTRPRGTASRSPRPSPRRGSATGADRRLRVQRRARARRPRPPAGGDRADRRRRQPGGARRAPR